MSRRPSSTSVRALEPELIAICSTGLTETKGDDVHGYLQLIRQAHPEVADTALVYVSTPDFLGAFQDGWARAVTALIEALVEPASARRARQINVLPGCHLTPGDIEELREIIEAFGLNPIFLPDVSGSLDGHMSDEFSPTTIGGTTLADARRMGASSITLALGEQMRPCAEVLEARTGVPSTVFEGLSGLAASDRLIAELAHISGVAVPAKYRRQRSQLQDAMLDAHFFVGGKRIVIGAEPDLLWALSTSLSELGATITAAVTTTQSPLLERLPTQEVLIGDLEDLEERAKGCDLMITHSHGRQAAARLAIPLHRAGTAAVRPARRGTARHRGISRHARVFVRDRQHLSGKSPRSHTRELVLAGDRPCSGNADCGSLTHSQEQEV